MAKYRVWVSLGLVGCKDFETVEVDDDLSGEELEAMLDECAQDTVANMVNVWTEKVDE